MKILSLYFREKKMFGRATKKALDICIELNDEYIINYEERFVAVSSKCENGSIKVSNYDFMNGDIILVEEKIA